MNEKTETPRGFKGFLKRKNIEFSFSRYAIDALGAMALGLFASLLIGTIIGTVARFVGTNAIGTALATVGSYAMKATGPAMAVAIGYALKAPQLVLFALTGVGVAANELGGAGGPLSVFIVTIFATELGKVVSKETKVDLIVTPFVTLTVGVLLSVWWAPAIGAAASAIGATIIWATTMQPFLMGMLVSGIVGIALTLPISSAAICAALGLVGLAGGAAVAGCCAHMVGFAVMSYKDNGMGGLVAQGLGTSMLQIGNLMKKPILWIPPVLASLINGPIATVLFRMEMNGPPIAAGMGTSGLVGQIGVFTGWVAPSEQALAHGAVAISPTFMHWLSLILVCFVLPVVLTLLFAIPMRKMNLIKPGDLKLQL